MLSNRYITDRFLPDKAIDLIDEAASKLRMEIDSLPVELDEVQRRTMQLEIEREALRKETDKASKDRLAKIDKQIADLKEESTELRSHWEQEKEAIQAGRKLKEELEQVRGEIERVQRAGDYAKASELQYGKVPQLEADIKKHEARPAGVAAGEEHAQGGSRRRRHRRSRRQVDRHSRQPPDGEAKSRSCSRWRNASISASSGRTRRFIAVANAIRRARAGLQDPNRPLGSFIFLGPTGVGKTELARALAEFLFDDEQAMVRIDMSEYQEKHTVSRMIGAPPGYVGYDEAGQLTEAVRRRPYAVVLFDEIEKAHPEVLNVMLQLLDDGRLTDGKGRRVDFTNTVVMMTSNIRDQESLRGHFRPEFINRIDEIVFFHSLDREHIKTIVDIQLRGLLRRLSERKITVELTDAAKDFLVREGYDPVYGARPLKRALQRRLLDPLALRVLEGAFHEGDTITVDLTGDELTFAKGQAIHA